MIKVIQKGQKISLEDLISTLMKYPPFYFLRGRPLYQQKDLRVLIFGENDTQDINQNQPELTIDLNKAILTYPSKLSLIEIVQDENTPQQSKSYHISDWVLQISIERNPDKILDLGPQYHQLKIIQCY
ncbi:hypothetical protein ABPG72_010693 [Tetrahymena utriculariae]